MPAITRIAELIGGEMTYPPRSNSGCMVSYDALSWTYIVFPTMIVFPINDVFNS